MTPKFILRGDVLLGLSGYSNAHKLSLQSRISHPTVHKYVNDAAAVKTIDLTTLAVILVDGCGLDKDQILSMKIGDLFDME
jgi:hypothetical protein